MNNTDKTTDFQEDGSYPNVDAVPFLTHVRAYYKYDINPASFIKDFPLKRWIPILLFNVNFKTYANHVIQETFFNFLFQVLSSSGFAAGLLSIFFRLFLPVLLFPTLPHLFFFSTNYRTRTFVRKKNLVLPRLRLKYSPLSPFLSFLSSLFPLTLNFISIFVR